MNPGSGKAARRRELPSRYLITPQPGEDLRGFVRALQDSLIGLGARHGEPLLVQLRVHGLQAARRDELAREVLRCCRDHGARLLLGAGAWDGEPAERLCGIGADGVHLPARMLESWRAADTPRGQLLAASCHDLAQLLRARALGADLVTLSPVLPTASHPGAATLGWQGLARLCRDAVPPVYALGGVGPRQLEAARAAGAHGVAGIRAFWAGNA